MWSTIQLLKGAENWKPTFTGFSFQWQKHHLKKRNTHKTTTTTKKTLKFSWLHPALSCCALLGHKARRANFQALFFYTQLDIRTPISLHSNQMSAQLNHPMTPPGEGCKQPQRSTQPSWPYKAPPIRQHSALQCLIPKRSDTLLSGHVYHLHPSKHITSFQFALS